MRLSCFPFVVILLPGETNSSAPDKHYFFVIGQSTPSPWPRQCPAATPEGPLKPGNEPGPNRDPRFRRPVGSK
jgi:hypothetical protein